MSGTLTTGYIGAEKGLLLGIASPAGRKQLGAILLSDYFIRLSPRAKRIEGVMSRPCRIYYRLSAIFYPLSVWNQQEPYIEFLREAVGY